MKNLGKAEIVLSVFRSQYQIDNLLRRNGELSQSILRGKS